VNQKRKRKKTRSLLPVTAEEEGLLKSLLENLNDININNIKEHIHSPEFARIAVERIPGDHEQEIKLLFAIRDSFGQKEVQKAVKKALFRLKRKGVSIPEPANQKRAPLIIKKASSVEPKAYLSPIDGTGSRGVLIIVPRIPRGVDVGAGAVSAENGITHFIYERCSKRHSRDIEDLFFKQAGKAIETSLAHAVTILENAYRKSETDMKESYEDYLRFRPWLLENVSLLKRPAIYDFIRPGDVSDEPLNDTRLEKLLEHDLMKSWLISPDKIWPVLDEIAKAEESPIIITRDQKNARINEIKEKAIKELFPDPRRLLLKEELEETAYLFFRLDQEENTRLCLAAASTLTEEDSIIRINPFLRLFLERSLDHCVNIMRKNTASKVRENDYSSNIITP